MARLQSYIDAGARHVILVPTTDDTARFVQQTQRMAGEILPYFRP